MVTTYSLHKISHLDRFGFNPDDYSRFKFGDEAVASAFGHGLADGFIHRHMILNPIRQQIVVIASPYSFIAPRQQPSP